MNGRQIALSAALAASGTASSAQPAPAEQWVGPPISTAGGAVNRADVVSELNSFLAQPQAASEAWAGTAASAGVHAGYTQRAEVAADTHMAIRARLTDYTTRNEYDPASAEAQRRNARYTRLRFGPEYTDEVSQLQDSSDAASTTTTRSTAPGT
ncbi:hypothetical protein WKW80_22025 [Variovorax humicola]|uniref:DUF4148 domain-containing protein n=1 Tax=Variovorax humicola TaxID=1769758 RepID=A0ABU8W3Q1_9BURK